MLGLSTTITSSSYGLGGGGSYSCFAAVKELVSAGLRCHSKGVNGEIIGDAVVAISRDLHGNNILSLSVMKRGVNLLLVLMRP